MQRLQRTRLRETEAEATHLLEGVAVIIYDPDTATLDPNLPPVGSGLRWDEFVETIAATYELHFEQVSVLRVRLFELSANPGHPRGVEAWSEIRADRGGVALMSFFIAIGVVIILGAVAGIVWQDRGLSFGAAFRKLRRAR